MWDSPERDMMCPLWGKVRQGVKLLFSSSKGRSYMGQNNSLSFSAVKNVRTAAVTHFLQRTSVSGPFIPSLNCIYFDFKSASKNNSTEAAGIVIKFHAACGPLGRDTLIHLKGFFSFQTTLFLNLLERFALHPAVLMTICTLFLPRWDEHSRTLMYIIPIHCARDTYFTPEMCIYIFILPVSLQGAVTLSVNICIVMTFMWMRAVRLRQPLMLQW